MLNFFFSITLFALTVYYTAVYYVLILKNYDLRKLCYYISYQRPILYFFKKSTPDFQHGSIWHMWLVPDGTISVNDCKIIKKTSYYDIMWLKLQLKISAMTITNTFITSSKALSQL